MALLVRQVVLLAWTWMVAPDQLLVLAAVAAA